MALMRKNYTVQGKGKAPMEQQYGGGIKYVFSFIGTI